jgi:hypothetical protein
MRKEIISLLIMFLILISCISEVSATTTIFLTSDNIIGENEDVQMLNAIKNYIEDMSDGDINVIIDSKAPSPGEGTRAIESSANVCVILAASDAGNFLILAKHSVNTNQQIIFVNTGNFDLDNATSLRRAWDDNYSSKLFAGINSPGKFLNESGISYIQPLKVYPEAGPKGYMNQYSDDVAKYIAQEIVKEIKKNKTERLDTTLIITHKLDPSEMAKASQSLIDSNDKEMNDTYNGYTAPQLLYMMSCYLNGNGLEPPGNYKAPDNPQQYSIFNKDSYTIYDYIKMGGIIKQYMDENGQAPNYIEYEGARLSYYDVVYNFAKITQNHTDNSHMDFDRSYHFDKVNDSILLDSLPYIFGIVIIMLACVGIRKIRRK